jgi:uncharacterized RDD family membrane protein YckC
MMDTKFEAIVEKLVREQGKDTLIDAKKCKAHLADYANNEFKKERHLLLVAIETGAGKAIANASDLPICKKIQIRSLKDDHFIDENAAAEAIDLLAFALRGDRSKSIASTPSVQPQSQSSQSRSAPSYNPPPQQPPPWSQSGGYPYPPNAPYPPPNYPYPQNPYPSQQPQVKYVGFWARLIATIIDTILLIIPLLVPILDVIVAVVYTFVFWINWQATPGKMAFKAKIVDAQTLGKPTTKQFIGRYFAYILSTIPLGLGFLWVAFDDKKRGWHDMLAGTLVIER